MNPNLVSSGVITKNFIKEEKEFEILLQELYTLLVIYNIKDQNNIWEFHVNKTEKKKKKMRPLSYVKIAE